MPCDFFCLTYGGFSMVSIWSDSKWLPSNERIWMDVHRLQIASTLPQILQDQNQPQSLRSSQNRFSPSSSNFPFPIFLNIGIGYNQHNQRFTKCYQRLCTFSPTSCSISITVTPWHPRCLQGLLIKARLKGNKYSSKEVLMKTWDL